MFARNVKITYNGVEFIVSVSCIPETPKEELERRALLIIINAFDKYGITIA